MEAGAGGNRIVGSGLEQRKELPPPAAGRAVVTSAPRARDGDRGEFVSPSKFRRRCVTRWAGSGRYGGSLEAGRFWRPYCSEAHVHVKSNCTSPSLIIQI
jgi:hypothetical protein